MSSVSIFRSVLIPSLTLTWFQKDPNVSHRMSQEIRRLWENCSLAFSSTMPHISGILPCFSGQSSTLVSCFWLKDRSRWELWPYPSYIRNTTTPPGAVFVHLPHHNHNIEVEAQKPLKYLFDIYFDFHNS